MKHINPEVFRAAAKYLESWNYGCCCTAIEDTCYDVAQNTAGDHLAYFAGLFKPDKLSNRQCWWPYPDENALTPRLIALELAALIAEEEAAALTKQLVSKGELREVTP